MATVNEVITKFSFVGSLKPQENFNKNLKMSIGLLGGLAAGIKTAAFGVATWTASVTEALDPMVQLSRETDVAVSFMQEMGFAASQNGSSLDAMQASIKELNKRTGEFARTGGGPAAEALLQLGLNVRDASGHMKTADRIIMNLQGSIGGFSKSEQADILDKLGIDPSLIQLLNQSSDSINTLRERARALGTVTKEQGDAAASLNDSNTTLRFGLQSLNNQIAVGLAPTVQKMTEGFIEFLIANKELIQNGIKKLGSAIVALGGFFDRMTPFALTAAVAFGVWKVATVGLTTAIGVLASPVVLITAGIAAIAIAVDDLIVAFRGGDSVIRDFILSWTGFDITPALQNAVSAVKEFVATVISEFKLMFNLISDFNFSEVWDRMLESFLNVFKVIKDNLLSLGGILNFDFLGDAANSVASTFGFGGGNDATMDRGVNNSTSTSNVSQSNSINVYTSDPVAAGQAAADFSTRQLRGTRQYFDRGGQ